MRSVSGSLNGLMMETEATANATTMNGGEAARVLRGHFTRARRQYDKMMDEHLEKTRLSDVDGPVMKPMEKLKAGEVPLRRTAAETSETASGSPCAASVVQGGLFGREDEVHASRMRLDAVVEEPDGISATTKKKSATAKEKSTSKATVLEKRSPAVVNEATKNAGSIVHTAVQRQQQLESKKLFRPASRIDELMPKGSAGMKSKVPKRREYGEEGDAGDAAHAAAMKEFAVRDFGSSHVQSRTIDERMREVGLFNFWLEQNNYGKYCEWQVKDGARGKERCLVAVDRDGTPRVPPPAAMQEYVLAMATADSESRPKGGWAEYLNGPQAKPGFHGKKRGELMGGQKAFGIGPRADSPFRYRGIEQQVWMWMQCLRLA